LLCLRYLAKAEDYLSCLVGHEGKGSLLSLLKTKGWASALTAGVSDGGYERNTAFYLFDVSITLTEQGLKAGDGTP
jgi:nardilysin